MKRGRDERAAVRPTGEAMEASHRFASGRQMKAKSGSAAGLYEYSRGEIMDRKHSHHLVDVASATRVMEHLNMHSDVGSLRMSEVIRERVSLQQPLVI